MQAVVELKHDGMTCALCCAFIAVFLVSAAPADQPAYLNTALSPEVRARDLVSRLTLDEKIAQIGNITPAIPRLHIPAYDWSNEALHGVAFNGVATVYPQAIGLAATWDTPLMLSVARAISYEARAKYGVALRAKGFTEIHEGLSFFSPNVNILRDPRWGRGQETYGEDPYLSAQMGIAFVNGMQGDGPYLRTIATLKHFAAHSGPEDGRGSFDSRVSAYDLSDTYLSQFQHIVEQTQVGSMMTSYNAINGTPNAVNQWLMETARSWGFRGYFVTDCGAISDLYRKHHSANSIEEAAADALNAGIDLACGREFEQLTSALHDHLVTEARIDEALTRLLVARIRLGMFDPPASAPYSDAPRSLIDSPQERALSLKAAQESLVLLRNAGHLLPFDPRRIHELAVIGPTASDGGVLVGNYAGTPSHPVTILSGILSRAKKAGIRVTYAPGGFFGEGGDQPNFPVTDDAYIAQALAQAKQADAVVLVLGIVPQMEGEGNDRDSIELPNAEERLARSVAATGKPIALVVTGGNAIAIPWEAAHIPAILYAWYPGEAGGTAVANALLGDVNPAGRLPLTLYASTSQLPAYTNYSMRGRTYRYFTGNPLYRFGDGLSYTTFRYSHLSVREPLPTTGVPLHVTVDAQNTGSVPGDDVVELYVSHATTPFAAPKPIRSLAAFQRMHLRPHETKRINLTIDARSLSLVDRNGSRFAVPGLVEIAVGGMQPAANGRYDSAADGLTATLTINGSELPVKR